MDKGEKRKKRKAKEAPKPRLILLFVMMALFVATPVLLSSLPVWASVMIGIFCADLFYFFFVVLKVQRNIAVSFGRESELERQAHREAMETARQIAQEGITLLHNEQNFLPLPRGTKLNLIGLRCVQLNYNGGGSAASDESKCVTLENALRETGFELNQELLNLSYNYLKNEKFSIASLGKKHKVKQGNGQKGGAEFVAKPGSPVKKELPTEALTSRLLYPDGRSVLEHAKEYSDVALVVLSRGGGEGYELDPDDLRLIESEKLLLQEVCGQFEKVILVLNVANTVEMGWLNKYPQIRAVLWIGFPGAAGTLALGDILNGTVNPSGHLPDTWAASNLSAPAVNNFCQKQENGTWSKESFHYANAPGKAGYFVHYSEGIYVGYRYYETRAAIDPDYDYEKEVVWPFGYGLSYTEYTQKINGLVESENDLTLTVTVANIGKAAGKALVQCYLSAPYTGRVERSAAALIGYEKTVVLPPGEESTVILDIPKRDMAAFDVASGRYLLEKGDYVLSLRSDSHTVMDSVTWRLAEEKVYEGTENLFADAATDSLTRGQFGNPLHRAFAGPSGEDFTADGQILKALHFHVPTDEELGLTNSSPTAKPAGLKLVDVKNLPKDDPKWDTFIRQFTVHELCNLCGNGAWQTIAMPRFGVPRTTSPDGKEMQWALADGTHPP